MVATGLAISTTGTVVPVKFKFVSATQAALFNMASLPTGTYTIYFDPFLSVTTFTPPT